MRHRSHLADALLVTLLSDCFGLNVAELTFMPVGEDGWAYRADTQDRRSWFVKLNQQSPAVNLMLTNYLCDLGLDWIPAPLPAVDGSLCVAREGLYVSVQAFVEGSTLMNRPVRLEEARRVGEMLAELHPAGLRLPDDLRGLQPRETFSRHQESAARVLAAAGSDGVVGKIQQELSRFIRGKQELITQILARSRSLGNQIRQKNPDSALCHADIHEDNIIASPTGKLWVIDWDGVLFAPRERDLFFWCDSPQWPVVSAGYGLKDSLDDDIFRYYDCEWVLQEIADYGENIYFLPLSDEQKQDSFAEFFTLFEPGNVVQNALKS